MLTPALEKTEQVYFAAPNNMKRHNAKPDRNPTSKDHNVEDISNVDGWHIGQN